ncbi:MAG: hypothetical protein MJZ90_06585 [Bacteroidales bacterium]|nr:hypothetical protein [Bacteroidales bacterium]
MEARKQLKKPANWQDFEDLCLRLWQAEWNDKHAQRYGRQGQAQHGVDICGHDNGSFECSGVQCKCVADDGAITEQIINDETNKAEGFSPKLEHYIIATTADADAKLQSFVLNIDCERRKQGLFSVNLYCWQDIEMLLDKYPNVKNWYESSHNINTNYSLKVNFLSGEHDNLFHPKFKKTEYIRKRYRTIQKQRDNTDAPNVAISAVLGNWPKMVESLCASTKVMPVSNLKLIKGTINHSYCPITIVIENDGNMPFNKCTLEVNFSPNVELDKTNQKMSMSFIEPFASNFYYKEGYISMLFDVIRPGETISKKLYFHSPKPSQTDKIDVHWKLLSEIEPIEDDATIKIEPDFEFEYIENDNKIGDIEYEDFVENITD